MVIVSELSEETAEMIQLLPFMHMVKGKTTNSLAEFSMHCKTKHNMKRCISPTQ